MRLLLFFFLLASCILYPASLQASSRSGFSFLKIGAGARAIGLGSSYTALANDVNGIYWNPAGLAAMRRKEISLMHGEWLAASNLDFLAAGRPLGRGVFAVSVTALTQASLEARDETGKKYGSFGAQDTALSLAYGQSFTRKFAAGAGLKLIQSRIGNDKGQGWALDLGVNCALSAAPLSFGMALLNAGPGVQYINEETGLPLTASLGAAWHIMPGFALAVDLKNLVYDHRSNLSFGTEYSLLPVLALRGGYLLNQAAAGPGALSGGFGIKISTYGLDYAFTPFGGLGNTHRISLSAKF